LPQTAFVRALVRRLVLEKDESVISTWRRVEAFGGPSSKGWTPPDRRRDGCAPWKRQKRIWAWLALGIRNVRIVANKIRPGNLAFLRRRLSDEGLSADIVLGYSEDLILRDLEGRAIFDYADAEFEKGARSVLRSLEIPSPA
jgi:hypothetical protein